MRTLIIVESPAKARTLGNLLSKDYTVKASVGHIRDLPPHEMAAKLTNTMILAMDPDRGGSDCLAHPTGTTEITA